MVDRQKVRVATCRDQGEAALIRALLGGHGIHVHIASEHHAAMFGVVAGGLTPMHVWVDGEDAEPAAELIRAMREDVVEPDADFEDALDDELDGELDDAADPRRAMERRRRTGVALLLSCVVTFGTGHLYAGALPRAIALCALEMFGWSQVATTPPLGLALVVGAVVLDAIGSTMLVRRDTTLPRARVVP